MLFNIPQFVDKEDKIVGPLTAKQLGWLFAGGGILLILYSFLDFSGFILAAIPVIGIVGALAFYRPYNQPLISFLFSSVKFVFRPKMYIWDRLPDIIKIQKKIDTKKISTPKNKAAVKAKEISEISRILDQNKI